MEEEQSTTTRLWAFFISPMDVIAKSTDPNKNSNIQSAPCVIRAFKYAFDLEKRLAQRLLCDINQLAIGEEETNKNKTVRVVYRNCSVKFPLIAISDFNYNMTPEGLIELINAWLVNSPRPKDYIHFRTLGAKENAFDIFIRPLLIQGNPPNKIKLEIRTLDKEGYKKSSKYINDQSSILATAKNLAKDSKKRLCYYYPVNKAFFEGEGKKSLKIQTNISGKIAALKKNYDEDIKVAASEDEKLKLIVGLVQKVLQLQPYKFANSLTVQILLNRLLHENKMPMSIMINISRLRGCSLDQVVKDVKSGQKVFLDLMCGSNELNFIDHIRKDSDETMPAELELGGFSKKDHFEMMLDICLENIVRSQMEAHPEIVEKCVLTIFECVTLEDALLAVKENEYISEFSRERVVEIIEKLRPKQDDEDRSEENGAFVLN